MCSWRGRKKLRGLFGRVLIFGGINSAVIPDRSLRVRFQLSRPVRLYDPAQQIAPFIHRERVVVARGCRLSVSACAEDAARRSPSLLVRRQRINRLAARGRTAGCAPALAADRARPNVRRSPRTVSPHSIRGTPASHERTCRVLQSPSAPQYAAEIAHTRRPFTECGLIRFPR
jgi:hypothetical protein